MKRNVGIVVVPKFDVTHAEGGAENICRLVALGLSAEFCVTVFYGQNDPLKQIGTVRQHTGSLRSICAFYIDGDIRQNGVIEPQFCTEAEVLMRQCDLIMTFERTLRNVAIPQITVLGGISYQHCMDIAQCKIWDHLIVPSAFLKNRCGNYSAAERITVISNGIDCGKFYPLHLKKQQTALLPFRPDWEKGYKASVNFIALVNERKRWGRYRLLITRQEGNVFSDDRFYDQLDEYASSRGVQIEYVPWCNEHEMNLLYNRCDFVLSLGTLEEGFGLTTVECIAAGKCVIAQPLGATAELLPDNMGLILLREDINHDSVDRVMEKFMQQDAWNRCEAGAHYIQQHYDIQVMQENYRHFIRTYSEHCNSNGGF